MINVKPFKIGKRLVGKNHPAYIIFEVASTHANNWKIAKNYVKQARESGADALKFQLFNTDRLLNPIASVLKPTYDYFKSSETPRKWFPRLKKLCDEAGLDLLCTPFDIEAADFLNSVGQPAIKIASGDLTNHPLLQHIAQFGKPVILSTGMATMNEVKKAVKILEDKGCHDYAILQCTSIYPMPYEDANLRVLDTFRQRFNTVVGYSDNGSMGDFIPRLAVAMGASVIEKHVTSQKQRSSMDDVFSLSVEEFKQMVERIKQQERSSQNRKKTLDELEKEFGENVEKALGHKTKRPSNFGVLRKDGVKRRIVEADERHWARRGIYPIRDIPKETIITEDLVISLRPDVGVSTLEYSDLLGKRASETLTSGLPILIQGKSVRKFCKSDIRKVYTNPNESQFVDILEETALFD